MKRTPIIPSEPLLPSAGPTTFTLAPLAFAPVSCNMLVPFIEQ
jgi:hypothetical protein